MIMPSCLRVSFSRFSCRYNEKYNHLIIIIFQNLCYTCIWLARWTRHGSRFVMPSTLRGSCHALHAYLAYNVQHMCTAYSMDQCNSGGYAKTFRQKGMCVSSAPVSSPSLARIWCHPHRSAEMWKQQSHMFYLAIPVGLQPFALPFMSDHPFTAAISPGSGLK